VRRWALMLGGLLIWAIHFLGIYGIASVADLVSQADAPAWRLGAMVFSGLCLAAAGTVLSLALRGVRARRQHPAQIVGFSAEVGVLGAGLGLIAIVWQSLPLLIGH
jgi:hypothetical protein